MISFIKGIIDDLAIDGATIDVNGVGYFLYLSKRHLQLLKENESVKIFTTLIHKEDSMKLYGFQSKEERELFNLLSSVNGIGSKTSLGLISEFNVSEIVIAIYANDVKKLSKAPGIGQKTAQRIILELKEKIATIKAELSTSGETLNNYNPEHYEETEAALFALGYSNNEVNSALKWLIEYKKDLTKSDDMIREALIWLSENY